MFLYALFDAESTNGRSAASAAVVKLIQVNYKLQVRV